MNEIGVRMMAAEIGQRLGVEDAAGRRAEEILEDARRIGAGHRGHGVEAKPEAGFEQAGDLVEIEQAAASARA